MQSPFSSREAYLLLLLNQNRPQPVIVQPTPLLGMSRARPQVSADSEMEVDVERTDEESETPPFKMETAVHETRRSALPTDFKTDTDNLPPASQLCVVCEDQSDGLHFGQLTCRACAAFFRRTVSLKLDYVCKHSGHCDIHKSARNMCRSCRYQKCLTQGMLVSAVQQARDSLGKRKDRNSASNGDRSVTKSASPKSSVEHPQPMVVTPTQTPATHVIQTTTATPVSSEYASITPDMYWNNQVMTNGVIGIAASPAPNYNVINQFSTMHLNQLNPAFVAPPREDMRILPKIADGFDQFSTLMQASMDFVKEQRDQGCPTFANAHEIILHESNFSESKKVCKMEYSILMKIVDSYFYPFNELDQKDKNYLFESFFCLFSNTHRAYRTYEVFGNNPNDDRLIMPDGGYVQISNLEKFYDNSPLIKVPAMAVANMFKDAMVFVRDAIVEHMRRIKITRMEMCFIFGIFLWRDTVANLSENAINIAHQTRDILLKDVHIYYKLSGLTDYQITQKIGNLLLMIPKLEDNYQIGDLFNMIETDTCCKNLNKVNL